MRFVAKQFIFGSLIGGLIGWACGKLVEIAYKKGMMSRVYQRLASVAIAILSFSGTELLGGNGFIAAYVSGMFLGTHNELVRERMKEFGEAGSQIMILSILLLFGMILVPVSFPFWDWKALVYAILSLTVIRMIPIVLSLFKSGLAISLEENAEIISQSALELLKTTILTTPKDIDPFEGDDWKEFLSGKLVIAKEGFIGGKQQTKVNLCEDVSFRAQISKKGMMKDSNPDHKGGMKGSWSEESKNSEAILTLTFEKKDIAPFVANLKIVDEELYVNGERHYASKTENCD